MNNDFAILGDLGNGRYVVRMFVGALSFDEVFQAPLDQLRSLVASRMTALAMQPDPSFQVAAQRPASIDQAVLIP